MMLYGEGLLRDRNESGVGDDDRSAKKKSNRKERCRRGPSAVHRLSTHCVLSSQLGPRASRQNDDAFTLLVISYSYHVICKIIQSICSIDYTYMPTAQMVKNSMMAGKKMQRVVPWKNTIVVSSSWVVVIAVMFHLSS
jgi:hypothetical protein